MPYQRKPSARSLEDKHVLKTARVDADMTARDLAGASGVSRSTISDIENHRGPDVPADRRRPTATKLSTALKLAAAVMQQERKRKGGTTASFSGGLDDFISRQTIFTRGEIYEWVRSEQKKADSPILRLVA